MPKIFNEEERGILKEKLMEIGLNLLESKQYRSTSVEEIAREAGIAKGTFYNFFPSKELFFFEIILTLRNKNRDRFYHFFSIDNHPDAKSAEDFFYNHYLNSKNIYNYFTEAELNVVFRKMPKEVTEADADSTVLIRELLFQLPNVNRDMDAAIVVNMMDIMANFASDKKYAGIGGQKETLRFLAKTLAQYIFGG